MERTCAFGDLKSYDAPMSLGRRDQLAAVAAVHQVLDSN